MLIFGILLNDEKCQNIDFLVSFFHTFAWRLNAFLATVQDKMEWREIVLLNSLWLLMGYIIKW